MNYYERVESTHLDGRKIFQSCEDKKNESETARLIEKQWNCTLVPFGMLAPVDWFAQRYGRLVGVLELKTRTHASDKFPTVFLNVRKWLAMTLASHGLDCPALYVVRFTDEIRWIPLTKIDAANHRIGGCSRIVKSPADIEPVIEVPIREMTVLKSSASPRNETSDHGVMSPCGGAKQDNG